MKDREAARAYGRKHYIENREDYIFRSQKWKAEHKERHIENSARWNKDNPERRLKIIRRSEMKKYGITQEQYNEALSRQNSKCAICETDNPKTARQGNWCIDHDHRTGEFRGLLCMPCNIKVGWYEALSTWFEKIEQYLQK